MGDESIKTLRDEFAIAAMSAQVRARVGLGLLTDETARKAYQMADAMLKARALQKDPT